MKKKSDIGQGLHAPALSETAEATVDPAIFIEEKRDAYVRYVNALTGRRWEVHGACNRRGDCLIGSVITLNIGTDQERSIVIRDHAHLEKIKSEIGRDRIDSEFDVPVTPEFDSCCGSDIFTYVELEPLVI